MYDTMNKPEHDEQIVEKKVVRISFFFYLASELVSERTLLPSLFFRLRRELRCTSELCVCCVRAVERLKDCAWLRCSTVCQLGCSESVSQHRDLYQLSLHGLRPRAKADSFRSYLKLKH
jgi:hypothetical protein